ncbi:disease resistance RPP8-like protein 3 [Gossypium hirsutum]|uniref:Disease resistance RPP8-like protein 3 n=1 Tax=Gossypium hirsutum TaxID=3635 RepID=A0ABM3AZT8_GOSHI|nr:disease resistance RPP8-like protein 3 [Gossypium hirsutum]
MKDLGEDMVKNCTGLPLAINILGGILATKYPSLTEWLKVSANVKSYLKNDQGEVLRNVLALSYDDLPPYLRPCFLYLSHFPEDYEIPVDRLIQLWVAEGKTTKILYIADQSNACQLSTIGRVRRVSVHKYFSIQCIKSPRLRSLLFFDKFLPNGEQDKILKSICLERYFDNHEGEVCNPLVLFGTLLGLSVYVTKLRGIWKYMFNNFNFLRVLDYERGGAAGCKLPNDIGKLIHLRFLRLRGLDFLNSSLPSSLSNLRCLQTLDLRIKTLSFFKIIHVPNVLWRMQQLRHLYLPKHCSPKTRLKLGTLRNLQTLVNFNTRSCYVKDLINMANIRELEIRGPFIIEDFNTEELDKNPPIIQSKYLHFLSVINNKGSIDPRHLAHLLLSCENISKLSLDVEIRRLPEYHYLSSNLAYIKLRRCELEEDPMPTLEKLPYLRMLELHEEAFIGKEMFCCGQAFAKLESLSLKELNNLEEWKVGEGAMPSLQRLEIQKCRQLKMLPDGLRFIANLQELKIESMPKTFKDNWEEGGEDFCKVRHVPSIIFQDCEPKIIKLDKILVSVLIVLCFWLPLGLHLEFFVVVLFTFLWCWWCEFLVNGVVVRGIGFNNGESGGWTVTVMCADYKIDAKMKKLGEDMVKHCAGLPLAIIILGGILATKYPSSTEWLKVSANVKSYMKNDKGEVLRDVLALSYDDLPRYLKSCFLYLSQFPEDYEIPADRLIQLWVAEGIVSSKQEVGDHI